MLAVLTEWDEFRWLDFDKVAERHGARRASSTPATCSTAPPSSAAASSYDGIGALSRWPGSSSPAEPASSARTSASALLDRGDEVVCRRQPDHRVGRPTSSTSSATPGFTFVEHDVSEYVWVPGPVDAVLHFASPASPVDYLEHADPDPQGRQPRHPQRARPGQGQGRPVPPGLDQRGLRRPAGAPPARVLLGPRQPDRPPRRVRRGQALRRGDDDGVPPLPRPRRAHRPHLQHLRPPDAARRRPGGVELPRPGAAGRAAHRLRRRHPDPQLLLRRRRGPRASSPCSTATSTGPVNIGNPDEFTMRELAELVLEVTGSSSEIVYEPLPGRRPHAAPARHHPAPAPMLGWEPEIAAAARAIEPHRRTWFQAELDRTLDAPYSGRGPRPRRGCRGTSRRCGAGRRRRGCSALKPNSLGGPAGIDAAAGLAVGLGCCPSGSRPRSRRPRRSARPGRGSAAPRRRRG